MFCCAAGALENANKNYGMSAAATSSTGRRGSTRLMSSMLGKLNEDLFLSPGETVEISAEEVEKEGFRL